MSIPNHPTDFEKIVFIGDVIGVFGSGVEVGRRGEDQINGTGG